MQAVVESGQHLGDLINAAQNADSADSAERPNLGR